MRGWGWTGQRQGLSGWPELCTQLTGAPATLHGARQKTQGPKGRCEALSLLAQLTAVGPLSPQPLPHSGARRTWGWATGPSALSTEARRRKHPQESPEQKLSEL